MARLCWGRRDRSGAWNALVRRQRGALLDVLHQEVECALRVRHDQFELWEEVLVGLDVVAVLHLVQSERRLAIVIAVPVVAVTMRA